MALKTKKRYSSIKEVSGGRTRRRASWHSRVLKEAAIVKNLKTKAARAELRRKSLAAKSEADAHSKEGKKQYKKKG